MASGIKVKTSLVMDKFNEMYRLIEKGTGMGLEISSSFLQGKVIQKITEIDLVDTGRLRASISYTVYLQKGHSLVGTNVEYAPHHEYGTSKMPQRPFLRNTFDENREAIKKIIRNEIEKQVSKL